MVSKRSFTRLVQCIILLTLLTASLAQPILSLSSSYSWREFIILHYGAVVRATLSLNLNGNVWTITSPLTINVELTLLKSINESINVILKVKHIIGTTVIYEESWYLGKLSRNKRVITDKINVFPKTIVLKKIETQGESLELLLTPEIILASRKGISSSGKTAPFRIVAVREDGKNVKIAYNVAKMFDSESIIEVSAKSNALWDLTKDIEPIELVINGHNFKVNESLELIARIKTNTTILSSIYIGSFFGEFNTKTLLAIPQDYLRVICKNAESIALTIEVVVIGNKESATIIIPMEILCAVPKPKVRVELFIQKNAFVKQKIPVTIKIINDDERQIFLEKILLMANNTLIFERTIRDVVSEKSEETFFTHIVLNSTASYIIVAYVKFRDFTLKFFEENSTAHIINILNPLHLKAKKGEYDVNEKIEFIAEVGFPEIVATLQYKLENSSKWIEMKTFKLKFPNTLISIEPLEKPGTYVFRLITADDILSNEVLIKINRKITVKVNPLYLEVEPNTRVNLTVLVTPIPSEKMQLTLLKQGNRTGSWITESNTIIKRTGLNYVVSFVAPKNTGSYVYRIDLVLNSKVIASSETIVVNVVEKEEEKPQGLQFLGIIKIGSGLLPLEFFTATISTLCLLSLIFWRRYRV